MLHLYAAEYGSADSGYNLSRLVLILTEFIMNGSCSGTAEVLISDKPVARGGAMFAL